MRWIYLLFFLSLTTLTFAHDTQTVEEFKGKVISIQKYSYVNKPAPHLQLILRTQKGEYTIEVGPQWFLHAEGLYIVPMDEIEVTGFVVVVNGKKIVLAQQVKKGTDELKLRDEAGRPLWKGLRKG